MITCCLIKQKSSRARKLALVFCILKLISVVDALKNAKIAIRAKREKQPSLVREGGGIADG